MSPSRVYRDWKIGARVNIDYHIELHGHYYSVPYALVHEYVDACLTTSAGGGGEVPLYLRRVERQTAGTLAYVRHVSVPGGVAFLNLSLAEYRLYVPAIFGRSPRLAPTVAPRAQRAVRTRGAVTREPVPPSAGEADTYL